MSVGNDEIDAQHQLWIGLINQLAGAVEQGDVSQAKLIHQEVLQYTHTHFSHEEVAMEAAEYADLDWHKQAHKEFVEVCESMVIEETKLDAALSLLDTMRHWLRYHICVIDKAYAPFL